MYTNGRFGEAQHVTDFEGRVAFELAQNNYRTLTLGKRVDGSPQAFAFLRSKNRRLRRGVLGEVTSFQHLAFLVAGWKEPASPACARLESVDASVDKNLREPQFKEEFLAKRREVQKRLHEGVLNRFVYIGWIAQIIVGDTSGSVLMKIDENLEAFAGRLAIARQK